MKLKSKEIGHLHDLITWYGINYAGTQIMQCDFQNKGTLTSPARLSFVLKVPNISSVLHLNKFILLSVGILGQIHFLLFLRDISPTYEIPLALTGRIYWEKTCLNTNMEPCDWICFPKYCFKSEILVTAFPFGQVWWTQNAYFLIENCLPWPSWIKSAASTPSESAVAPNSLQSRTVLSLVHARARDVNSKSSEQ